MKCMPLEKYIFLSRRLDQTRSIVKSTALNNSYVTFL